jgi:hypothetical protein
MSLVSLHDDFIEFALLHVPKNTVVDPNKNRSPRVADDILFSVTRITLKFCLLNPPPDLTPADLNSVKKALQLPPDNIRHFASIDIAFSKKFASKSPKLVQAYLLAGDKFLKFYIHPAYVFGNYDEAPESVKLRNSNVPKLYVNAKTALKPACIYTTNKASEENAKGNSFVLRRTILDTPEDMAAASVFGDFPHARIAPTMKIPRTVPQSETFCILCAEQVPLSLGVPKKK